MKKLILACDDDEDILEVIKIILESKNYNVITCCEEEEIVDIVKDKRPDLILLDIWMSTKDITQTLEKIRAIENFNSRVILVSALNNIREISENNKVYGFLPKPFSVEKLLDVVEKGLE